MQSGDILSEHEAEWVDELEALQHMVSNAFTRLRFNLPAEREALRKQLDLCDAVHILAQQENEI